MAGDGRHNWVTALFRPPRRTTPICPRERSQCSFSYSLLLLLECSSWPTRCSLERDSHGSIRWTGHVKRRSGTGDLNPGDGRQSREVRLLQFLSATASLSVTSQLDCTRTTGHQSPAKPAKDQHHESLGSRTQSVFLLSLSFPTKMFCGTHPTAADMPPHYRSSWYHRAPFALQKRVSGRLCSCEDSVPNSVTFDATRILQPSWNVQRRVNASILLAFTPAQSTPSTSAWVLPPVCRDTFCRAVGPPTMGEVDQVDQSYPPCKLSDLWHQLWWYRFPVQV